MVHHEKVSNSPPSPLQLRPCVNVLLIFQFSGWRCSAIGLGRSLPLHLQKLEVVKGYLNTSISIDSLSFFFKSMRGHSHCDYSGAQKQKCIQVTEVIQFLTYRQYRYVRSITSVLCQYTGYLLVCSQVMISALKLLTPCEITVCFKYMALYAILL